MSRLWKGLLAGSVAGGLAFLLFSRNRGRSGKGLMAKGFAGVRKFTVRTAKRVRRNARDWKGFARTGSRLYRRSRGIAKVARKWFR